METTDEPENMHEIDFKNLFEILPQAQACSLCGKGGATIKCQVPSCTVHVHYPCGAATWNFAKNGSLYKCETHRSEEKAPGRGGGRRGGDRRLGEDSSKPAPVHALFGSFQHNLFSPGSMNGGGSSAPSNANSAALPRGMSDHTDSIALDGGEDKDDDDDSDDNDDDDSFSPEPRLLEQPLSDSWSGDDCDDDNETKSMSLSRTTPRSPWGFALSVAVVGNNSSSGGEDEDGKNVLVVQFGKDGEERRIVKAMNGTKVGSAELRCLLDVMRLLRDTTILQLQLQDWKAQAEMIITT